MFPIVVLDIVLLLVVARLGVALFRGYRFAARAVPTTIAGMTPGWVRLTGHIIEEEGTLVSPISERRCVFYQLLVKERQDHGLSKVVIDERQHCVFLLEDTSGRIPLETQDAVTHLKEIRNAASRCAHVLAERYGEVMATGSFLKFVRRRPLSIQEWLLRVDQQITVMGEVKLDEHSRPKFCSPLHIYDGRCPNPMIYAVLLFLVLGLGLALVLLFPLIA